MVHVSVSEPTIATHIYTERKGLKGAKKRTCSTIHICHTTIQMDSSLDAARLWLLARQSQENDRGDSSCSTPLYIPTSLCVLCVEGYSVRRQSPQRQPGPSREINDRTRALVEKKKKKKNRAREVD